jgi:hypothetical protein
LKRALERAEGRLGTRQISRLQSLSKGGEILLALGARERFPAGERAALPELHNVIVGTLSTGQIVGIQRLSELLQIALPSLKVLLDLLVNGTAGNGCCRHWYLLRKWLIGPGMPLGLLPSKGHIGSMKTNFKSMLRAANGDERRERHFCSSDGT